MQREDAAQLEHTRRRRAHWDRVAQADQRTSLSGAYHQRLAQVYQSLIPRGQRVLELGCGAGDLLASLRPSLGVGIDFSGEMLHHATYK
ncbi:MAG TPA: class I SAM-dependent methyltransferase, partial [Chloroflexota bacterium]